MSGVASNFNLTLIEAYKKCPALYDCDNPDYKVHLPTKEGWQQIADVCGAGAHDCRVRWKALRDRYIKERKRLGIVGDIEALDKRWPLYSKMNFLEPYVEKQKSASRVTLVPVSGIGSGASTQKDDAEEDHIMEDNSDADADKDNQSTKDEGNVPTFNAVTVAEDALKSEDAFCHRLISEVKQHKLIYDHTDPSYRVATVRTQTWDVIAGKLNDSSYSTGKDLRKKWRSLRDKFIRERRLIREALEAGQVKASNWGLFEELSFLEPYLDTSPAMQADESDHADHTPQLGASAVSGMQQSILDAFAKSASSAAATSSLELLTNTICNSLNGQSGSQRSPEGSDDKIDQLGESSDDRSDVNRRKRKFRVEQGEELSLHREILRCVRAGAENLTRLCQAITDENEDMLFARYIATLLQNMPPERRAQMKLQIFATLHSIPESSLTHM